MIITDEAHGPAGDLLGQQCGGSYTITALLGEGGMGLVYRAVNDMLAGKEAAVKVLHHEMTRRPSSLARFRAEVYAAGRIADPNIVRVFDAGTLGDGRLYMMMEYCAGGSLEKLLEQQGPLSFELALTIVAPICSALDAAHNEAKITHRDIKPANILLVSEAGGPVRAKLADFGIAKLHDAELEFGLHTATKKILGSPGYMAPEQCSGRGGVDHRADIYALGSLLYEIVTGQRPYSSTNLFDLITSTVRGAPFPRPSELRRDLPPKWEEVILACLAYRREDRIPSVREVVHRLAAAIPNGEVLMGFVAPRLVENKVAPNANTINDEIGAAATKWVTHWSGAETQGAEPPRGRSRARTLATLGLGALLGGGLVGVVGAVTGGAPASAADKTVIDVREAGLHLDAGPLPIIAMSQALDAAAVPDDAPAASTRPAAPPPIDAGIPTVRSRPSTRTTAPADKGSSDGAAPPDEHVAHGVPGGSGPPSRPDRPARSLQAPAAPGTLRVLVDPWADVSITGRSETYTTPVTVTLPAGAYRVVLSKGSKKEAVEVKITSSAVTTIKRAW